MFPCLRNYFLNVFQDVDSTVCRNMKKSALFQAIREKWFSSHL